MAYRSSVKTVVKTTPRKQKFVTIKRGGTRLH